MKPTRKQMYHARTAAKKFTKKVTDIDIASMDNDPLFYHWLAIEEAEYKRRGGRYGINEDDRLHDKCGTFAQKLINSQIKAK